MATEVSKKAEVVSPAAPPAKVEAPPDNVVEEKSMAPHAPPLETKPDNSKALAVADTNAPPMKKTHGGSFDRDVALAQVEKEKTSSFIKAWEENEKTKVVNKAQNKLSAITSWENSKKAAIEAKLRKIEEQLEKKKAEYGEKKKNEIALIHKEAEEKRAMVEAKREEEILKAEEMAAKYRATGNVPKKIGCFGC